MKRGAWNGLAETHDCCIGLQGSHPIISSAMTPGTELAIDAAL